MGSEAYMLDPVHAADECFSQVERTKTGRPGKLCLDFDKEPFLFSTTVLAFFICVLHIIGSFATGSGKSDPKKEKPEIQKHN